MRHAHRLFVCLWLCVPVLAKTIEFDLSLITDWGPPTAADSLAHQLREARWRQDPEAFAATRQRLWQAVPHHAGALNESVLWLRDRGRLAEITAAADDRALAALIGLEGIDADDLTFVRGTALVLTGRLTSARAVLESVAEAHPSALDYLFWIALNSGAPPGEIQAAFARAAAEPEAAAGMLSTLMGTGSFSAAGRRTHAIAARLQELSPHLILAERLAVETVVDSLRLQRRTLEEAAAIIDRLHAERPAAAAVSLADLLGAVRHWHSASAVLSLFEPRAHWLEPRRRVRCHATLLSAADRSYQAYQVLLPLLENEQAAPPREALGPAVAWHPDAGQIERRAWRLIDEDLGAWARVAPILVDRGLTAAADSLKALAEQELPLFYLRWRVAELRSEDPTAAAALGDRAADSVGPRVTTELTAWLAASRGRIARVDSLLLAARSPGDQTELLVSAVLGAATTRDRSLLRQLAERFLALAPDRTDLIGLLADLSIQSGDHEQAERLITLLTAHPHPPPSLYGTRIDLETNLGRPGVARAALVDHLALEHLDPDQLLRQPVYAVGAGWQDLADQALAALLAIAPEAPEVILTQARVLTIRGEHHEARALLEPLQRDWPNRSAVRQAVVAASGSVEAYDDTPLLSDARRFAGLDVDYESVDWILAARAQEDEFTGDDVLILRDRHTYHLVSRDRLIKRRHLTVQILSKNGATAYETERHTFNAEIAQPRVISARTITAEGEVREVPRSSIMITAPRNDSSDVSEFRDLVIPFSGVRPGTVVDYCLQTEQHGFLQLGVAFTHLFGIGAPQREERVEVVVADGVPYHLFDRQAPIAATPSRIEGGDVLAWSYRDAPPLVYEPDAPAEALYPEWIGIATYDDWNDLAREYGRRFWLQTEVTDDLRQLATALTAGLDSDHDRLQAIYTHLRDELHSVGIQLGEGRFVPTPAVEILARGYGDCKDKVALLTALLAAVDIRCQPALVATRPRREVEPAFPDAGAFDHLIAYIPEMAGGVFCDPTLGGECVDGLPAEVVGRHCLVITRDGGRLETLPELDPARPQIELEVDLYPEPGGRLRAEVVTRLQGPMAQALEPLFAMPDTNVHRSMVSVLTMSELHESLALISWNRVLTGCDAYEIHAVLRDSTWTSTDSHDARLLWVGPTDTGLGLPSPDGRQLDLAFDAPQVFRTRVRAHEAAGWRVSERHAPIHVKAPHYAAEVVVDLRDEGGRRRLEIAREERFGQRVYGVEDYAAVHDQCLSYRLATYQPIQYHRQGDRERIDQLRAYCREHPDDLAFAMQAAMQVLGGDVGGEGQAGRERRQIAREMLDPLLHNPATGGMPFLLAASIAVADDRYAQADSLLSVALTRSPGDLYLLSMAAAISGELDKHEESLAYLRQLQDLTGNPNVSYAVVGKHLELGQDADAEREVQRLALMTAEVDSLRLALSYIEGYLKSYRLDEARQLLATRRESISPMIVDLFESDIASRERDWDTAIARVSVAQNDRPLDPTLNNNLAWYLACAGRDLDRAEYLARVSLALRDAAGANNTLAVILLQQGRYGEAREMLAELHEDDRPSVQLVNGYFLGLCDWLTGEREAAVALWQELVGLVPKDEFNRVVDEALAAIGRGDDPSWLYLREPGTVE